MDVTQLRPGRDWQRFLTAAIENANDAVILYERIDEHDRLTISYVNRMFEEQTGYSRAEAIGRTRDLLFGPLTDQAVIDESAAAILQFRPARGELLKYRKDGSTYWVEFNTTP